MFKILKKYSTTRVSYNERAAGCINHQPVQDQIFFEDHYIGGIRVYRRILFKERIPVYAWTANAVLGFTDWKTGCPADIWKLCTGKDL